ncbi:hypothetical protein IKR55_05425, partial [bacterium]|nr:hypothetical protein [bacterium]
GFRMALGKDGKPIEKVEKQPNKILSSAQNEDTERKVLKQLSPTQKAHIMQTTRTSMTGLVR